LSLAFASVAAPQGVTITKAPEVRAAVEKGDLAAALMAVTVDCDALLRASRHKDSTVVSRAARAREALACAKLYAAVLTAEASSTNIIQMRDAVEQLLEPYAENEKQKVSEEKFLGLSWGLGLGFSVGIEDHFDEAEIVNGKVRVTSDVTQQPRVLFEYHRILSCNNGGKDGTRGCGPFVAVAATDNKLLSGVAVGAMYGMKKSQESTEGFSIGVGAILDAKVRSLGAEFKENEPPPNGETTIRFLKRSRWSFLFYVTRTL
jgi:hypothetical protein